MATATLKRDERVSLGVAIVLHAALIAVLLVEPAKREAAPVPERMTVSLATEVGLEASSPTPVPESRAAVAPTLSDEPAPLVEPMDEPLQRAADTTPRSLPKAAPKPATRPAPRTRSTPKAAPKASAAPQPSSSTRRSGGSRIGADFLPGAGSSSNTDETRAPAATFGRAEQAALRQALARQLRDHWRSPQGVDVDQLVTMLDWDLNPDGSLNGRPRIASQSGINASNRAQASVHAENAIRAVQLAAPFDLPDQFYDKWKRIRNWRFDRRS